MEPAGTLVEHLQKALAQLERPYRRDDVLPNIVLEETKRGLRALLEKAKKEKLTEADIRSFFGQRYALIRNSNMDYTKNTSDPSNRACIELAKSITDRHFLRVLYPNLQVDLIDQVSATSLEDYLGDAHEAAAEPVTIEQIQATIQSIQELKNAQGLYPETDALQSLLNTLYEQLMTFELQTMPLHVDDTQPYCLGLQLPIMMNKTTSFPQLGFVRLLESYSPVYADHVEISRPAYRAVLPKPITAQEARYHAPDQLAEVEVAPDAPCATPKQVDAYYVYRELSLKGEDFNVNSAESRAQCLTIEEAQRLGMDNVEQIEIKKKDLSLFQDAQVETKPITKYFAQYVIESDQASVASPQTIAALVENKHFLQFIELMNQRVQTLSKQTISSIADALKIILEVINSGKVSGAGSTLVAQTFNTNHELNFNVADSDFERQFKAISYINNLPDNVKKQLMRMKRANSNRNSPTFAKVWARITRENDISSFNAQRQLGTHKANKDWHHYSTSEHCAAGIYEELEPIVKANWQLIRELHGKAKAEIESTVGWDQFFEIILDYAANLNQPRAIQAYNPRDQAAVIARHYYDCLIQEDQQGCRLVLRSIRGADSDTQWGYYNAIINQLRKGDQAIHRITQLIGSAPLYIQLAFIQKRSELWPSDPRLQRAVSRNLKALYNREKPQAIQSFLNHASGDMIYSLFHELFSGTSPLEADALIKQPHPRKRGFKFIEVLLLHVQSLEQRELIINQLGRAWGLAYPERSNIIDGLIRNPERILPGQEMNVGELSTSVRYFAKEGFDVSAILANAEQMLLEISEENKAHIERFLDILPKIINNIKSNDGHEIVKRIIHNLVEQPQGRRLILEHFQFHQNHQILIERYDISLIEKCIRSSEELEIFMKSAYFDYQSKTILFTTDYIRDLWISELDESKDSLEALQSKSKFIISQIGQMLNKKPPPLETLKLDKAVAWIRSQKSPAERNKLLDDAELIISFSRFLHARQAKKAKRDAEYQKLWNEQDTLDENALRIINQALSNTRKKPVELTQLSKQKRLKTPQVQGAFHGALTRMSSSKFKPDTPNIYGTTTASLYVLLKYFEQYAPTAEQSAVLEDAAQAAPAQLLRAPEPLSLDTARELAVRQQQANFARSHHNIPHYNHYHDALRTSFNIADIPTDDQDSLVVPMQNLRALTRTLDTVQTRKIQTIYNLQNGTVRLSPEGIDAFITELLGDSKLSPVELKLLRNHLSAEFSLKTKLNAHTTAHLIEICLKAFSADIRNRYKPEYASANLQDGYLSNDEVFFHIPRETRTSGEIFVNHAPIPNINRADRTVRFEVLRDSISVASINHFFHGPGVPMSRNLPSHWSPLIVDTRFYPDIFIQHIDPAVSLHKLSQTVLERIKQNICEQLGNNNLKFHYESAAVSLQHAPGDIDCGFYTAILMDLVPRLMRQNHDQHGEAHPLTIEQTIRQIQASTEQLNQDASALRQAREQESQAHNVINAHAARRAQQPESKDEERAAVVPKAKKEPTKQAAPVLFQGRQESPESKLKKIHLLIDSLEKKFHDQEQKLLLLAPFRILAQQLDKDNITLQSMHHLLHEISSLDTPEKSPDELLQNLQESWSKYKDGLEGRVLSLQSEIFEGLINLSSILIDQQKEGLTPDILTPSTPKPPDPKPPAGRSPGRQG